MTKKNKTLETQEVKPVAVEPKSVVKSESQAIWDEIKDIEVSMFGLPEQKISNFCSPVFLDDKILFLNYKLAAVFPVLEEKFRSKYLVDTEGKMLKIIRASQV